MSDTGSEPTGGCACKVGRVQERYGLGRLDAELAARWTAPTDERASLRELARRFNRRVARAALRDAGVEPIDGEAANTYRVLTDDDVTSGVRVEARDRLARSGVDPEALESSFLSHQSLHTHFLDCLDIPAPTADRPDVDRERDRLDALQGRLAAVARESLERLDAADRVALDGFDVLVGVDVHCDACGAIHDLHAVLDRGGCPRRRDAE